MKGIILDFNQTHKTGIILSNSSERYEFSLMECRGDFIPAHGDEVDFIAKGNTAQSIYCINKPITNEKSKIIAALLAFFLGAFGFHKFYLGYTSTGVAMLLRFIFGWILLGIPSLIICVIAFIESIIYITRSDHAFYKTYVQNQQRWF